MSSRPPISTLTSTLLPNPTLFRSHVNRTKKAAIVDAAVLVEAAVLHRDHRPRQVWRQLPQAVGRAEAIAERGEARAVGSQQRDVGPPGHLLDLAEFGQVVGVPGAHAAEGTDAPDSRHGCPGQRPAQQPGCACSFGAAALAAAATLRLACSGPAAAVAACSPRPAP